MRIRVVLVGKVRERYLQQGIAAYLMRLGPYARVELLQVEDDVRALRALEPGQYVVALDGGGQALSSAALAAWLAARGLSGQSNLAFVVGGHLGHAPEVLARADFVLSLGPLTFLHQMVPLILLEQIYRGFKINAGEPYHR